MKWIFVENRGAWNGTDWTGLTFSDEDALIAAMQSRGFTYSGRTPKPWLRNGGRGTCRRVHPQLEDQPVFDGLEGPALLEDPAINPETVVRYMPLAAYPDDERHLPSFMGYVNEISSFFSRGGGRA